MVAEKFYLPLSFHLFGAIPENDHHARGFSVYIFYRRCAVFNGNLPAILRSQDTRFLHFGPLTCEQYFQYRIFSFHF